MPAAPDFFDTNVFIYAVDDAEPAKQQIARALLKQALDSGSAVTSWQVVQECLNVLKHRYRRTITAVRSKEMLHSVLTPLWKVMPSPSIYTSALDVQDRYGFAWYDSLVVASALHAGCKRLLTEDLQHGQRIASLHIENPFRA